MAILITQFTAFFLLSVLFGVDGCYLAVSFIKQATHFFVTATEEEGVYVLMYNGCLAVYGYRLGLLLVLKYDELQ